MENLDPEIKAMASVAGALTDLDAESRTRVLHWAAAKFGVSIQSNGLTFERDHGDTKLQAETDKFPDFVDLFDAVNPSSNLEKVLTGAYWLQAMQGAPSWQSQQVNTLLKDTGNGIDHIIDALDSAQGKTPALVRQMAKSGKSRQARKTYKLTTSGIKFIEAKAGGAANVGENGVE